jgi:hypothetical protein
MVIPTLDSIHMKRRPGGKYLGCLIVVLLSIPLQHRGAVVKANMA